METELASGASHIFWLSDYGAAIPSIDDYWSTVVFETAFDGERAIGFRPAASRLTKKYGMHPRDGALRIPRLLGDRIRGPREGEPLHRRLQQDPVPPGAWRPDAEAKAQDRRLNGRSASPNRAADIGRGLPPKKIIDEKAPQGCCDTKSAEPKTGADSGECGKRGQSMPRSRNHKTTPIRIVQRLSALPPNDRRTNAPKIPKIRTAGKQTGQIL